MLPKCNTPNMTLVHELSDDVYEIPKPRITGVLIKRVELTEAVMQTARFQSGLGTLKCSVFQSGTPRNRQVRKAEFSVPFGGQGMALFAAAAHTLESLN